MQVVCRPELAPAFAAAGLPVHEVDDAAAPAVADIGADNQVSVLLIDETIYAALPSGTRRRLAKNAMPMVVPFPAPTWRERPGAAEEYIIELLRQAIGYRVKLR